ncbi:MAG: hypothetical protein COY01_02920 [Candidatus Pacebacteria bacterium CG_4_10_14_0_2_um_filter_40_20]|nr:MAG: hypothetical protein COY01_02920 [Candidatus Pacebacteria bacterium CG_4_10_14_0_2_um_filter_40_20]
MKKEKILRDFVVHTYELSDYWALAKIQSIRDRSHIKDLTSEEYDLLQKLIEDKATRTALEKLLVDCSHGYVFSLFAYIDGATGIKPLEIVNADTGEPIAEDMLHEHLVAWVWGDEWDTMMKKVAKSKKLLEKSFQVD